MKLSKTSWLVLTVGVAIIIFASLGVVRLQQLNEQNRLNEQLSLTEQRLDRLQVEQLSSQKEELERRLSQTMSQLEAAKASLSQPIESITVSDTLFDIAEACGVEITEFSSSELASSDLEGITCSVLPLTVTVEGDAPNLINFISKLNDDFLTGAIHSININVSEDTGEERSSANIRLLVYNYRSD